MTMLPTILDIATLADGYRRALLVSNGAIPARTALPTPWMQTARQGRPRELLSSDN